MKEDILLALYWAIGILLLLATLIFTDCYNGTTTQERGIVREQTTILHVQVEPTAGSRVDITIPRRKTMQSIVVEKWSSWSGAFKTVKIIND